jgi:hypothetical protein
MDVFYQKVKIINPGKLYSSYEEAAQYMRLKNFKKGKDSLKISEIYNIVGTMKDSRGRQILGITNGRDDFIIGIQGVQFIDIENDKEIKKPNEKSVRFNPDYL